MRARESHLGLRPFTPLPLVSVLALAAALLGASVATAGNPRGAAYCPASTSVFWFVQISDLHIGTSGTNDSGRLTWMVTTAKSVINPEFIVATGDLTDSTNGNIFGYPNGPYQAEWDQYAALLKDRVTAANYFDLPGNHDAYSDRYFAYYLANSVQGKATGNTQVSWTVSKPYGTYHFLGVNTADNTGAAFSISFPYGDHAGLDNGELSFILADLGANAGANLTFVFGHHPVTDTGVSGDTWLFYGQQEFVADLDQYAGSLYGYGHTHAYSETLFKGNAYTGLMAGDGIHYDNITSLGKDSPNQYMVYAVDCDGVSAVPAPVSTWPVVVITAPVNSKVGSAANPYAYTVPASATNFVRALVFDTAASPTVTYRIDGGTAHPMTRVSAGSPIFQGNWDASMLVAGSHTIVVTAVGSTTRSDTISVTVTGGSSNRAPVAVNDSYSTPYGTTLSAAAPGVLANDSDADGDTLRAVVAGGPAHGSLTLAADGSFTYGPTAGYSGSDSFTYMASDGSLLSNAATVAITVAPPATTDKVAITAVSYASKTGTLKVEATSDKAPTAKLTVSWGTGSAAMSYSSKTKKYTYQGKVTPKPGSVTVTSTLGGSATAQLP